MKERGTYATLADKVSTATCKDCHVTGINKDTIGCLVRMPQKLRVVVAAIYTNSTARQQSEVGRKLCIKESGSVTC